MKERDAARSAAAAASASAMGSAGGDGSGGSADSLASRITAVTNDPLQRSKPREGSHLLSSFRMGT
jgi:hypothetical protein